jgi:DNA-binding response OmpR family regulator
MMVMQNKQMEIIKNKKILYVDDSRLCRVSTTHLLEDYCDNIFLAKDGKEALKQYALHKPHILIMDIEMPNLNGIEVVKKIRQYNQDVIIIMLTAHKDEDYLLELINLKVQHFILKPVTDEKLKGALENIIEILGNSDYYKPKRLGDDFFFDELNSAFVYKNINISLTPSEKILVSLLLKNNNEIVTYNQIVASLITKDSVSEDSIKAVVKRIRKKSPINFIKNISKVGYKLLLNKKKKYSKTHIFQLLISRWEDELKSMIKGDDFDKNKTLKIIEAMDNINQIHISNQDIGSHNINQCIINALEVEKENLEKYNINIKNNIRPKEFDFHFNELEMVLTNIFNDAIAQLIEYDIKDKTIMIFEKEIESKYQIIIKTNSKGFDKEVLLNINHDLSCGSELKISSMILHDILDGDLELQNMKTSLNDKTINGTKYTITIPAKHI